MYAGTYNIDNSLKIADIIRFEKNTYRVKA